MEKNIKTLREEIKRLATEQTNVKAQRKTVSFEGTRTLEPYEASYKVLENRKKLSVMYTVLNKLRGRNVSHFSTKTWGEAFCPIDKFNYNKQMFDKLVEKMMLEYGEKEAVCTDK